MHKQGAILNVTVSSILFQTDCAAVYKHHLDGFMCNQSVIILKVGLFSISLGCQPLEFLCLAR